MTSTSPAFGADSAPGPPDYAPIPQSAPGNRRFGPALLVIATAQFMVVLGATIVNESLPTWSLVTRPSPRDHGHPT